MSWRIAALIFGLGAALCAQEVRPKMALSYRKSIEIALAPDGNTRVQLAEEAIQEAKAKKSEAFSALLPNVDASWSARSFTQDLQTFGLSINIPPQFGFSIPSFVGPVSVYDLRATATQTIFDLSSIRRWQAAGAQVSAAKLDTEQARLDTSALVAKAYLNAARAETAVQTAQANIELAERELKLADSQKAAGTGTGLDIVRAQVQVATQKQVLIAAKEDRETSRLNLLRAMNLSLDLDFDLTDPLKYESVEIPDAAKAVQQAIAARPDLKAEQSRERAAKLSYDAARYERLPSVGASGDYGDIGTSVDMLRPTRTVGVNVKLPLFDGGRRDAQRAEAASDRRSEAIRKHDLLQQAENTVRTAIEALRSADDQAKVTIEALALSEKELEQAERRYKSGITTSLEVTDAQTQLSRARENKDAAVYRQRAANIDLLAALGDRNGIAR
jgi:outer membrane protein TolC